MDSEGIAFVAAKAEPAKGGKADPKKDNKKGGKAPAAAASVKEEKKGLALFGGMSALEVIGETSLTHAATLRSH